MLNNKLKKFQVKFGGTDECKKVKFRRDNTNESNGGITLENVKVNNCNNVNTINSETIDEKKKKVDSYFKYLDITYGIFIKNIHKDLSNINEDNKTILIKILSEFAQIQDSMYARKYMSTDDVNKDDINKNLPGFTDDLYEILFYIKFNNKNYDGDYSYDIDRMNIMHDAWSFARIYKLLFINLIINTNNIISYFNENNEDNVIDFSNTNEAIDLNKIYKIILPNFLKINETDTSNFILVKGKRINQFRKFDDLPQSETIKDTPPMFTTLCTINENIKEKIISIFYSSFFEKEELSKGGKDKSIKLKATEKRIKIGGRSAIVYKKNHGKEYIKSAGKIIEVSKLCKSSSKCKK